MKIFLRFRMAWFAFWFPEHAITVQKINEQFLSGTSMGLRGTPIISFWPMREKWKSKPDYWELEGRDGDIMFSAGMSFDPAEYRLIYFKLPQANLVCQLAYEKSPGKVLAWDEDIKIDYVSAYEIRRLVLQQGASNHA